MTYWIILGIVLVGGGALVRPYLTRRRAVRAAHELDSLVVEVLGPEWARRTGLDLEAIRNVCGPDGDPAVVGRLRDCVRRVLVRFERDGGASSPVHVLARCAYIADGSEASARTDLEWFRVPDSVREEFIRSDAQSVDRRWVPGAGVERVG